VDLGVARVEAQPVNRPSLNLALREDQVHLAVLIWGRADVPTLAGKMAGDRIGVRDVGETKTPAVYTCGHYYSINKSQVKEQHCQMKKDLDSMAYYGVMEWMLASPTALQCAKLWKLKPSYSKEASMKEVTIIGVDLAKNAL
jgi:hypothetical protein